VKIIFQCDWSSISAELEVWLNGFMENKAIWKCKASWWHLLGELNNIYISSVTIIDQQKYMFYCLPQVTIWLVVVNFLFFGMLVLKHMDLQMLYTIISHFFNLCSLWTHSIRTWSNTLEQLVHTWAFTSKLNT